MALFYKPVLSQMKDKTGKKTWHLTLVKSGEVTDTEKLAKKLSELSALSPGDTHNVIQNLTTVMREELLNGHSVKLNGWGTFTLKARTRGKGVYTPEEVGPNQIVSLRCQFTPEFHRVGNTTTRALTEGAKFIHIDKLTKGAGSNTDSGNGGDDDNNYIDPDA